MFRNNAQNYLESQSEKKNQKSAMKGKKCPSLKTAQCELENLKWVVIIRD